MRKRATGLPKAMEEDLESGPEALVESLEDFIGDMFGVGAIPEPTPGEIPSRAWLQSKFKTKSAIIRYLVVDQKHTVKDVAKALGLKYQHVRNVSTQVLKRGPNEDFHLAEGQISSNLLKPES